MKGWPAEKLVTHPTPLIAPALQNRRHKGLKILNFQFLEMQKKNQGRKNLKA